MRVLLLLCLLVAPLLSGCKKSSPEFYKLESNQATLVAREGDDAWGSPEMDAIAAGLSAVPDDALEKPRAQALAAKIAAEKARVEAERVPAVKVAAPDPFAGRFPPPQAVEATPPPPEEPAEAAAPSDGGEGPTQPWPGMDEKSFVARFGACFGAGPAAALPDGKPASAYVLSGKPDCQKQFGVPNGVVSYLFTEKGLWGKATETTQVRDAGTILLPQPPAPPVPAPPPPILTTPGAPLPEGYENPR